MVEKGNKPLVWHIFNEIVSEIKSVGGIENVYITNRPKEVNDKMKAFAVVSLPTEIRRTIIGNEDTELRMIGVIHVFTKSKTDNTPNIVSQTSIAQSVMDLFPINGEHIVASLPSILIDGDDGNGFQITSITFKIRTKFNSHLK